MELRPTPVGIATVMGLRKINSQFVDIEVRKQLDQDIQRVASAESLEEAERIKEEIKKEMLSKYRGLFASTNFIEDVAPLDFLLRLASTSPGTIERANRKLMIDWETRKQMIAWARASGSSEVLLEHLRQVDSSQCANLLKYRHIPEDERKRKLEKVPVHHPDSDKYDPVPDFNRRVKIAENIDESGPVFDVALLKNSLAKEVSLLVEKRCQNCQCMTVSLQFPEGAKEGCFFCDAHMIELWENLEIKYHKA